GRAPRLLGLGCALALGCAGALAFGFEAGLAATLAMPLPSALVAGLVESPAGAEAAVALRPDADGRPAAGRRPAGGVPFLRRGSLTALRSRNTSRSGVPANPK